MGNKEEKEIEKEVADIGDASEQENAVKITVSREAAEKLLALVSKINDGFFAGRVHRQDVASWLVLKFWNSLSEIDVQQIREAHYNDAAMLEALYRRVRETGQMPEFLRDALRKQFEQPSEAPKRSKKALTKKYISGVHSVHEDAS